MLPFMANGNRREHERIELRMRTRMWLDETMNNRQVEFEGYATTRNLSIGGCFLESQYLLPAGYPLNMEMEMETGELLRCRGDIIHRAEIDGQSGMGLMFTEVDAENRERLLRFFVSDSIKQFYRDRFVVEFPHLESVLTLKDVALILNLWEDKEGRLTALRLPGGTQAQQARLRKSGKGGRR